MKLSIVLATYNEEKNLEDCLNSVRDFASEIVIVDGGSKDQTVDIAKHFSAKVIITDNPPIFHINKQKALEQAQGEWILQLDADERVNKELAEEIIKVIHMTEEEIDLYQQSLKQRDLFLRHQKILEKGSGQIGDLDCQYVAFFIPRLNYFLGKYLKHGGIYPDGVIRLVKRGKAHFPCQSVHEQIAVDGKVGWLQNNLLHFADPTFSRYLKRNNRYIGLLADQFTNENLGKDPLQFINFCLIKPFFWFFLTQIRHKGILDGIPGIMFSFFSALRFPRAYIKYLMG